MATKSRKVLLLLFLTTLANYAYYHWNRVPQNMNSTTTTHATPSTTNGEGKQLSGHIDLRIIVMTFNRPTSLRKLLQTLDDLEMDGDSGVLEIWIDRSKENNAVDNKTLQVARSFSWSRGTTTVRVHEKHVGIYGQWIDTWQPPPKGNELALLLEDDLSVSPYAYRWLKAVHKKYGSRSDIAGYTLQSEGVELATNTTPLRRPENQAVFLYKLVGSWGYAPHPASWLAFQNWYHRVRQHSNFHPYVPKAAKITAWYKGFEKLHKQDTMWTMWHIYYCDRYNMYTLYNNINVCTKDKNTLLAANRKEIGLHFARKLPDKADKILKVWSDDYINLPDSPVKYELDGKVLASD